MSRLTSKGFKPRPASLDSIQGLWGAMGGVWSRDRTYDGGVIMPSSVQRSPVLSTMAESSVLPWLSSYAPLGNKQGLASHSLERFTSSPRAADAKFMWSLSQAFFCLE